MHLMFDVCIESIRDKTHIKKIFSRQGDTENIHEIRYEDGLFLFQCISFCFQTLKSEPWFMIPYGLASCAPSIFQVFFFLCDFRIVSFIVSLCVCVRVYLSACARLTECVWAKHIQGSSILSASKTSFLSNRWNNDIQTFQGIHQRKTTDEKQEEEWAFIKPVNISYCAARYEIRTHPNAFRLNQKPIFNLPFNVT